MRKELSVVLWGIIICGALATPALATSISVKAGSITAYTLDETNRLFQYSGTSDRSLGGGGSIVLGREQGYWLELSDTWGVDTPYIINEVYFEGIDPSDLLVYVWSTPSTQFYRENLVLPEIPQEIRDNPFRQEGTIMEVFEYPIVPELSQQVQRFRILSATGNEDGPWSADHADAGNPSWIDRLGFMIGFRPGAELPDSFEIYQICRTGGYTEGQFTAGLGGLGMKHTVSFAPATVIPEPTTLTGFVIGFGTFVCCWPCRGNRRRRCLARWTN